MDMAKYDEVWYSNSCFRDTGKSKSTKCGNSYCKKTELSCRGGEGTFLRSSVSSMVSSIP